MFHHLKVPASQQLLTVMLLLMARPLLAQEIEPRAFSNAPIGTHFLVAGVAYSAGALATDPSLPLTAAKLDVITAVLAYAHVFEVNGQSGKFDLILPYSDLDGSALLNGTAVSRDVTGMGDARLRLSANFYGSPALNPAQFSGYQQDLILGASLQLGLPNGQYDANRLINIGTNRWSLRPELGASQALGNWTWEVAGGATFYSDNNAFYGGKTRAQAPVYAIRSHLIYGFSRGLWASVDGSYYHGGQTEIDGVAKDDHQRNWRSGLTLTVPLTLQHSLKGYASRGVSARTGNNYDLLGLLWQYRW